MIKAIARTERGPLVVLGLTKTNIEQLMKKDPILINGEDLDLGKVAIMILGGQTKADIVDTLHSYGLMSDEMAAAARRADDGHGD